MNTTLKVLSVLLAICGIGLGIVEWGRLGAWFGLALALFAAAGFLLLSLQSRRTGHPDRSSPYAPSGRLAEPGALMRNRAITFLGLGIAAGLIALVAPNTTAVLVAIGVAAIFIVTSAVHFRRARSIRGSGGD